MSPRRQTIAVKRARKAVHAAIDRWLDACRNERYARHLPDMTNRTGFDEFNVATRHFRKLTDPLLILVSPQRERRLLVCVNRRLNRIGCDNHWRSESFEGDPAWPSFLPQQAWLEARGQRPAHLWTYAWIDEPPCADAMAPELLQAFSPLRVL